MSSINGKLGLKPATRRRAATHGRMIVSDARCPKCGGRHVIGNEEKQTRLCGSCGHIWPAPAPA